MFLNGPFTQKVKKILATHIMNVIYPCWIVKKNKNLILFSKVHIVYHQRIGHLLCTDRIFVMWFVWVFSSWTRSFHLYWEVIFFVNERLACLLVCLFRVCRPNREFFSHIETSPLPVKGCKFWPRFGNHDLWEVSVLYSVPHLLWHAESVVMVISVYRETHTYCPAFSSGAVTICFYDLGLLRLGFKHPTVRLRSQSQV